MRSRLSAPFCLAGFQPVDLPVPRLSWLKDEIQATQRQAATNVANGELQFRQGIPGFFVWRRRRSSSARSSTPSHPAQLGLLPRIPAGSLLARSIATAAEQAQFGLLRQTHISRNHGESTESWTTRKDGWNRRSIRTARLENSGRLHTVIQNTDRMIR